MNVFYLHSNPCECARMHCLVHQNKMIVEYAQLMSTAHRLLDGDDAPEGLYKATHKNHPSAIWLRQCVDNYNYVLELWLELCTLYEQRTGKEHATYTKLAELLIDHPRNMSLGAFSEPPQCVTDEYKGKYTVQAYRSYMRSKLAEWQSRDKPIKVEFMLGGGWYV